ncbi:MAG: prepilin-type N-terminal cleavage/methylation domain-containing protein [Candidatus Omnitrophota bacterium]
MERSGFTLIELMIAAAVSSVALLGILGVFSGCFGVDESAGQLTIAVNGARYKIEEMRTERDMGNPRAAGHYNETIPNCSLAHSVAIDIIDDGSDPDGVSEATLYWISVSVTWMTRGGRIIGEDDGTGGGAALDGILNGGEDSNNNNLLDSPAQIVTLMRL